ncbi:MAG: GNAT family N-acetyltransferase [Actinomycetota bacterium]|nr:GNAT family N-acetyltransferase [Actinomycetota bacterium]
MEGARPARPGDLAACARLLEEARARASTLRGGPELLSTLPLPTHPQVIDEQWLSTHWGGTDRGLFAGTIDEVVVGVAGGHIATHAARRVGTVDWCYVEAGARGVGVGTALAEALVEWFSSAGCVAVDAPALPGDRGTKRLLESLGLSARLLVLRRPLP